jgi:flagellar hook-associated protein 2
MGTVGLSFGSPTGGTGFNVSSTVSSIVANLQNVETPWKTQLTTLQAQDTAISSLGTLFSNLSNDMSALTDVQGTMATKTGSSSDTNVLTLTAATSSAIAGTHTVEVGNLALTSSGYLPPVSSPTAVLTGSITLQVGASGTPQTITLNSSDNTLNGLAAAINSSAVGVTASVLTDASGSRLSLVSGTSGAEGNLTVSANTLAPVLNFTGSAGTVSAASTGTLDSIPNLADTLAGSLSIQVGTGAAQTVTLDSSDNTLAGLMNAVNNTAGIGVTASIVTNSNGSSSLSLVSNTAGTAGSLTVSSSIANDTAPPLAFTGTAGSNSANSTGTLASIAHAGDTLAGSISIQVGMGAAQTVTLDSSDNTLAGLVNAINNTSGIGVTASIVTNSDGSSSLSLLSNTAGRLEPSP